MHKVLIGSKAIKHHFKDFNREPKDFDYAIISNEFKTIGSDCMVIPLVCLNSSQDIATPEMLLTLKLSHINWDKLGEQNWKKHMFDIQFLLSKGINYDFDLMIQLRVFWAKHYNGLYKSDLKLNANEFFDNAIKCRYDHDFIHEILCESPTYKKVLKDGKEVEPCPIKYSNLSNEEKDCLLQEEVMVMAYERYGKKYYKEAYYLMINKYIRNHLPDFCFDYVIRNYIRLSLAPYNFIQKINNYENNT